MSCAGAAAPAEGNQVASQARPAGCSRAGIIVYNAFHQANNIGTFLFRASSRSPDRRAPTWRSAPPTICNPTASGVLENSLPKTTLMRTRTARCAGWLLLLLHVTVCAPSRFLLTVWIDLDSQSADPGVWGPSSKADDATLAKRKIIRARRGPNAGVQASEAASAGGTIDVAPNNDASPAVAPSNPFAGRSLVAAAAAPAAAAPAAAVVAPAPAAAVSTPAAAPAALEAAAQEPAQAKVGRVAPRQGLGTVSCQCQGCDRRAWEPPA